MNRQTKREFFPKGTEKGKRAILFNLAVTNGKEIKEMTVSQRLLAIAFLKDCENTVKMWIKDFEMPFPGSKTS